MKKMITGFGKLFSELCEEWALANSRECVEGVVGGLGGPGLAHEDQDELGANATSEAIFTLKYLGSTLVETPSNEEATAEAIKTVITMVRINIPIHYYFPPSHFFFFHSSGRSSNTSIASFLCWKLFITFVQSLCSRDEEKLARTSG